MKVGTDGVLLAAWCSIDHAQTVLDIGCGSGVIAMIVAQRNPSAIITGLEIEVGAAKQAADNFRHCPWPERLLSLHNSLQSYSAETKQAFDHVISNPPFFEDLHHSSPHGLARNMARNDTQLNFEDLFNGAASLLNKKGRLSLILPVKALEAANEQAVKYHFSLHRKTNVIPIKGKAAHRYLLEFSTIKQGMIEDELIIQKSQVRNDFTKDYIELVRDLYTIL